MTDKFSFISNILNILALWILSGKIGALGTTYAIISIQCLLLLWTFLGSSVTEGLGRFLRSRNQKGQYKSAKIAIQRTFFMQCIWGLLGFCIVLFAAGFFANSVLHIPYLGLLLTLTAPILFFRSINAVLLGNFRGNGDYSVETVVHFLRPIGLLILGNWFCGIFEQHGHKISNLLKTEEVLAMYCGAGIILAVAVTEAILLPILILLYRFKKRTYFRKGVEGGKNVEKAGRFLTVFYWNTFLSNMLRLMMRLPFLIIPCLLLNKAVDTSKTTAVYGEILLPVLISCGIPCLLLGLLLLPNHMKFENYYRKEEKRYIKSTIQSGLCSVLVWGSFPTVLVICLADAFVTEKPQILVLSALLIILISLGYYMSNVLSICGKKGYAILSLLLVNVLYFIFSSVATSGKIEDIQSVFALLVLLTFVYCVMAGYFLFHHVKLGFRWMAKLLLPLIGNCVIGLIVFLLCKGMLSLVGSVPTVLICLVLACALYLGVLLLWQRLQPQEPDEMVGGKMIHRIGEKFHIY